MSNNVVPTAPTSTLFQGCYFHFIQSQPSSNFVSFDTQTLKSAVVSHGGRILSKDSVDQISPNDRCYIIRGYGFLLEVMNLESDKLIMERMSKKKKLHTTNVKSVNPLWIKACLETRIVVKADKYPLLFQPQSFPLHRLPRSLNDGKGLLICVTGFVGLERVGLKQLIMCIGGSYSEKMTVQNTHLICKEAKGPKFLKAHEWNIHVITVDWLYHVMKHGYHGEGSKSSSGCEDKFQVTSTNSK